jgi:peptidoglycan/LPS O-acetylase OafA/YrhL
MSSTTPLPPLAPAPKPYFPALTGLRAVAAWLIFLYHTNPFARTTVAGRFISEFHMGVTLFFVLSGLLICVRYSSRLELSWRWLGQYVRHRFARIYPLYLLLTVLFFVIYQLAPQYDIDKQYTLATPAGRALIVGLNLSLLRSWFTHFRFTGIYTGWTLTVEEFFYLLAPVLVLALRHRPARLPWFVAGFLAVGCTLVALPPRWHVAGFFATYEFMLSVTFFGRSFEFLAGIYLAIKLLRQDALLRWVSRQISCTALGIVWIVGCVGLLAVGRGLTWQPDRLILGLIFINNVVLVPGICLLLYGLIHEPSPLRRVLSSRLFDLLGKASYAFYLIHAGLLNRFLDLHVTTNLPLKFAITNALAIVLYKGIEYPLYKKLTARNA